MPVAPQKIWQDNVIALAGGIKKPEQLAARGVPNGPHLIQEQEAIVTHLHDALIVMQPVKPLNCPVSRACKVSLLIWPLLKG